MDKERTIKTLKIIKDRYFRPVIANKNGIITHFSYCMIYQAEEVYGYSCCDCGLMSDLNYLSVEIGLEKVYPKYGKDLKRHGHNALIYNQETHYYEKHPNSDKHIEEARKLMIEAFGEDCFLPVEKSPEEENEEWAVVEEVFGKEYVEYIKGIK